MSERDYTEATKSALFALSAKCYFPKCKQPSVTFFGDEPEKKVQIAHIHAVSPRGPRYKVMTREENDAFKNLLLLCGFHHKKVDKKANEHLYPATDLKRWKVDAEKDLRTKIDGLDRLTEDRLEEMLDNAARFTKQEVDNAIDSLRIVSRGAAEILQVMFEQIESHYLDADAVAMLDAASHRLGDLEGNAATLDVASHRFGDLEGNASTLEEASRRFEEFASHIGRLVNLAGRLEKIDLSTTPGWFDTFRYEYNAVIDTKPDVSEVVSTIEYAGQRVVDQIERKAASIDVGEPPNIVDDAQRWKFFAGGAFTVLAVAIIAAVLVALAENGVIF